MSSDIFELKEKIVNADNALIIAHVNPDADTIGSALGLKYIFEKLGKTAFIVCDTPVSDRICGFLEIEPELDRAHIESTEFLPECVICVDVASPQRLGKYEGKYYSPCAEQNRIDIVIDHHYSNQLYGKYNYVDEKACAAGQIIFDVAKIFNIEISRRFARDIYCAISSDSGSFGYESTTPKTHFIAAELISTGFDFAKLHRLMYHNKSLERVAVERLAYNALKFYCDGRIALIAITSMMKKEAGLEGAEIGGISEIARGISGVEVGVTMKQREYSAGDNNTPSQSCIDAISPPTEFKVSLRSNEYINVSEIAAKFGGGGHQRAAGCKIQGNLEEAEKQIISAIEEALTAFSEELRHSEEKIKD